jgi:predicted ATP-dependent endonuclease of OLD family
MGLMDGQNRGEKMRINRFNVQRFRSIIGSETIELHDYNVIIGPNNEGKTNILDALMMSINTITGELRKPRRRIVDVSTFARRIDTNRFRYNWIRDYPISLQSEDEDSEESMYSEFQMELELNSLEKKEFEENVGPIRGNLEVTITASDEGIRLSSIKDTYDNRINHNNRKRSIIKYIGECLDVQYISAIRTSNTSLQVIEELIEVRLRELLSNPEYESIIDKMRELQKPIIENISESLTISVSQFIPEVKAVKVNPGEGRRFPFYSSSNLTVDDGQETDLELKGEGIKSLIAISILHHIAKQKSKSKSIVLAIEEPETHLHPGAISKLRDVLQDISETYQVIITTHSQTLINNVEVNKNIIVSKQNVRPARSISEIRDVLGIVVRDSLENTRLVLLVEGATDEVVIRKWLEEKSLKIQKNLNNSFLIVDTLNSAGNLGHKASMYQKQLCRVIVYLDHDASGLAARDTAVRRDVMKDSDIVFSTIPSMKESEIEDLIIIDIYKERLEEVLGLEIPDDVLKSSGKKWTDRIKEYLLANGKEYGDLTRKTIKTAIGDSVSEYEGSIIKNGVDGSLTTLKSRIETLLG